MLFAGCGTVATKATHWEAEKHMAGKRKRQQRQRSEIERPDERGSEGLTKIIVIAVLAGGLGLILSQSLGVFRVNSVAESSASIVKPSRLTVLAAQGRGYFEEKCASCHGKLAAGTEQGPPFIHAIYNPGHHSDEAFMRAPRTGVRAHHWNFGDMPPVEGVTDAQLRAIVAYVRELQRANGITFQPHRM